MRPCKPGELSSSSGWIFCKKKLYGRECIYCFHRSMVMFLPEWSSCLRIMKTPFYSICKFSNFKAYQKQPLSITRIPRKCFMVFQKNHRKTSRFFELIPGTLESSRRFLSSSSAIAVLENEQLKTFEMNKSVKHVVLSIWTYLSSVSHICIPRLRVYSTAHFWQLATVSNFKLCLMIHNNYFSLSAAKQFWASCNIHGFLWCFVDWWLIVKNLPNVFSKTHANEYCWEV